ARAPLRAGESLRERIEQQLAKLKRTPHLIRSFFMAPSVAYISDC
ncbi:MAG: IS630 family transposase, partial [Burkholderiales bacterium]|nr:IS630 family transposase [Burkholderiales bacterium]